MPTLLSDFQRAAAAPRAVAAQTAQIRADRRYDAQVKRLSALADEASRERLRLANTLR